MQGRLSDPVNGRIQAFPWDSWQDEFKTAADHGFIIMEWTLDADGLMENPLLTDKGRAEIKKLSEKYRVTVKSLTGDFLMHEPFWKTSFESSRKKLIQDFLSVVNACSIMNIETIVVPLVDNGSITCSKEEITLIETMNKATDFLDEKKVKIAFETDFSPEKNKDFITRFRTDIFGINYDTGNSAALGFRPSDEFKIFSHYITNVHLKDRKFNGSTVPLGAGDTNFLEVFQMLNAMDYNRSFILQTARALDGNHVGALIHYREFVEEIWREVCN